MKVRVNLELRWGRAKRVAARAKVVDEVLRKHAADVGWADRRHVAATVDLVALAPLIEWLVRCGAKEFESELPVLGKKIAKVSYKRVDAGG